MLGNPPQHLVDRHDAPEDIGGQSKVIAFQVIQIVFDGAFDGLDIVECRQILAEIGEHVGRGIDRRHVVTALGQQPGIGARAGADLEGAAVDVLFHETKGIAAVALAGETIEPGRAALVPDAAAAFLGLGRRIMGADGGELFLPTGGSAIGCHNDSSIQSVWRPVARLDQRRSRGLANESRAKPTNTRDRQTAVMARPGGSTHHCQHIGE